VRRGGALIWTMVALIAMGVAVSGATTTFLELSRLQRRTRERLVALECGQRELERARAGAAGPGSHVIDVLPSGRAAVSISPDRNPALRQVSVAVTWGDADGERRMQWTTLVKR